MAYLAVDLDVLEKCEHVARATGADPDKVFAGLFRLWKWCFTEKVDRVLPCQVDGFGLGGQPLHESLSSFGFLEPDSNGFRVRGAGRYLRVMKAQKDSAARTNAMKRASHGTPNGIPHDLPTEKDGLPNGTPNGLPHGIPNGTPNGLPHGPKSPSPPTPPSSPEHRTSSINTRTSVPSGTEPTSRHTGEGSAVEPPFRLSPDASPPVVGKEPDGGARLKHIGPDTPKDGLDTVDACRRAFAVVWKSADRYNGTAYPDQPGPDRKAIAAVLDYHRRNKLATKWQDWMLSVFRAYLDIGDDRLVVSSCHPLRMLPANLPRVVTAIKADA